VLAAEALLAQNPTPSEEEIRTAISGNICRCTGYNAIVAAIKQAAEADCFRHSTTAQTSLCGLSTAGCTESGCEPEVSSVKLQDDVRSQTPTSLDEALALMADGRLTPYAGGTDLMVSEELGRPFLFLHRVEELKRFERDAASCFIGAGLTYSELLAEPRLPGLLRSAIGQIAAPPLRNSATIGGNVANASPKADAALALVAADAKVCLASATQERQVPIRRFYRGRGQTIRKPDELIVGFLLPLAWLDGYSFQKVGGRAALAISRVSFAALYAERAGRVAHLSVAFGAVEDVITCHPELDSRLIGKTTEEAKALRDAYLASYAAALQPIQGRVSAAYRKRVCLRLLADFLEGGES